jgi:hypothetical protein
VKKTFLGILLALALSVIGAMHVPTQARLELYDIKDLVYSLDGPGVDISLAGDFSAPPAFEPQLYVGSEMADVLRKFIPGLSDSSNERVALFVNGYLVVRAGIVQQCAVGAFLAGCRTKNSTLTSLGRSIARARGWLSPRTASAHRR